jgi:hypothetical protein
MKFAKLMCVTTLALLILLAIPVRLTAQDNQDRKSKSLGDLPPHSDSASTLADPFSP